MDNFRRGLLSFFEAVAIFHFAVSLTEHMHYNSNIHTSTRHSAAHNRPPNEPTTTQPHSTPAAQQHAKAIPPQHCTKSTHTQKRTDRHARTHHPGRDRKKQTQKMIDFPDRDPPTTTNRPRAWVSDCPRGQGGQVRALSSAALSYAKKGPNHT